MTPSSLAAGVLSRRGEEDAARKVAVDRIAPRTAPASFAQERLWFLDRLGQGGPAYNLADAIRIPGELDAEALEAALGAVIRHHEPLRTTFREVDGVPVQIIHPFAGFTLPIDDLEGEPEDEARRIVAGEAARAFDLAAGPLFRARLLRLSPADHLLFLTLHQIVADAGSLQVLSRETWTLYRAFRDGIEPQLPEVSIQYADHVRWHRERAGSGEEAAELAYWVAQLAGAPELLELPADHPRPPVPTFRGGAIPVDLSADRVERLRELARAEGASLFVVVLAAFQVLLSRWSGSEDLVVGTHTAGRTRPETEEAIGLFTNTLVVRTDLSGDPSFRTLAGRVRERVLGAYEHQDVPFERVVAAVKPERNLSHSTLFQVVFLLGGNESAPAVDARGIAAEPTVTRFDLTLRLHPDARGGLSGALEYSADLFERGTVRRMVEHLERVVEQVCADPDRTISRVKLMGTAERARVLAWNRTTAAFPADRCIHHLFEAQAARTPDAVAIRFGRHALTYREVDERANQVAWELLRLGVRPETRVAIWLERGPELVPAILGAMKAGAAYVPLDPGYPDERIAYMLDDSGAAVLLTQARLRGRVPPREGMDVVSLDAEWNRIAAGRGDAPETGVGPENLCYVIYTSGSTGRPKGVAMHHRGVCNYVHWGVRFYRAGEGEGAPVFTSMAVDLTLTNLLPLFAGRTVHLLPEESPIEALAAVLGQRPGFGLIKITPLHLGLLNDLLAPEELASAARTLVVGADFLSAEPTLPWQEHAPGVRLMNEYGPTETVVGCSAYVLPIGKHRAGPVPVGHPIQNLAFYVLDAHGEPVPVGLPGELYIGGVAVARGYLDRPGLTAERFVPDPFASPGARMYRTGDRARWQADGNLLILGRTDHQVKVRGYRVELGEVEAALRRLGAREALAVVREDRPGDRRLVAYVVGGDGDPAEMRDAMRRTLPEYMVPDAIVVLGALPQTPTGKIDRKTLPAPGRHATGAGDGPRTATEAALLRIWETLLGVEGIGTEENFFRLGGNSLLALRLLAHANRAFGCDLPVATLFTGATVRRMAEAIEERTGSGSRDDG
jgi:amino acid adenylation domain-containing protein